MTARQQSVTRWQLDGGTPTGTGLCECVYWTPLRGLSRLVLACPAHRPSWNTSTAEGIAARHGHRRKKRQRADDA